MMGMMRSRLWLLMLLAFLLLAAPACGGGGDDSSTDDEAESDDFSQASRVNLNRNRSANRNANANRNRNTNANANTNRPPAPEPEPEPEGPPPGSIPVTFTPLSLAGMPGVETLIYQPDPDLAAVMIFLMEAYDRQYDLAGAIREINKLAQELADDLGDFTTIPVLREKLAFRLFTKRRLGFWPDDSEESRTDVRLFDPVAVLRNREGNCLSLTALVQIVADRLGLGDCVAAATVPNHTYALVGKSSDDPLILETSQPNDEFTHEMLAKQKGLDWPLPSGSPFCQRLTRTQFISGVLGNFAVVLDAAGRTDDSVTWLEHATSIWRDNVHANTNLASQLLRRAIAMDDADRDRRAALANAVKYANSALRSWPADREAYKMMAVAMRLQDRIDDSLKTLDDAARYFDSPSYELDRLRVLTLIRGERGADALPVLDRMKDHVPADNDHRCEYQYSRAISLILANRPDEASDPLREALKLASEARIRIVMDKVMQAADRNQLWKHGAVWFDLFARRAETNDQLVELTAQTGIAFGTHASTPVRGEDEATDEQIDAAVQVLSRVLDLQDTADVRRELFVILWNRDRSAEAMPHGLRAAELHEDPKEAMELLLPMAFRFANAQQAGAANLQKVIEVMKTLPPQFAIEATFFEGVLAIGREPQTRETLTEALRLFEKYLADGGTNQSAKNYRDQLKDALGN